MRTASGLAMSVVVVALVAAAGGALKLYVDRQSMQGMIDQYGEALATLPFPPGPAAQSFVAARERAGAGDFAGAQAKLKEGKSQLAQAEAAGGSGQGPGQENRMCSRPLELLSPASRL